MKVYYNENDPKACAWLRELMKDGLIPQGHIDERSITDVQAIDLDGFEQCHFFAGIGGWPYALQLAGWAGPVWTGSCPCQDFSNAGKRMGFEGDRDLWPVFFNLIQKCRPHVLFGEQVDDSPEWYDRMHGNMEAIDYAIGSAIVPAFAAGARQTRERIFFVADSAEVDGRSHDCMDKSGIRRTPQPIGRLPRLSVSGRWWSTDARPERMPTLVRSFNGLSAILGGFGNAIVPQAAAQFVAAYMETRSERSLQCA